MGQAQDSSLAQLANSLVTANQLRLFDETQTLEDRSLRYAQALLTQAAGVLLRLPQEVVASALVILQKFWIESRDQRSTVAQPKVVSEACIYLAAKISFPVSPRSVCNVYAYLLSPFSPLAFVGSEPSPTGPEPSPTGPERQSYYVSDGEYERERDKIFLCESLILTTAGFDVHVTPPHPLALTYLQALGASSRPLANRVMEHLNGALPPCPPQMLYLTHQPNVLAVASIYLSAKDVGVKLVDGNWWEIFDVEREALGFVVLALGSFGRFAASEKVKWTNRDYDFRSLLAAV